MPMRLNCSPEGSQDVHRLPTVLEKKHVSKAQACLKTEFHLDLAAQFLSSLTRHAAPTNFAARRTGIALSEAPSHTEI